MPYRPSETLLIEHEGPVATLTMNIPEKRNAFLDELHLSMQEVWYHLETNRAVNAVVLTGAGRIFSAGGNIPGFIRDYEDPEHRRQSLRRARRLMDEMAAFPKPVVAAVNGPAIGLGCNVALSCDLVVMAESAYLADTHVNVGLVCGDGGAVAWPLLVGLLKAKELLLLGDKIPASRALEIGLANRVVPDGDLMAEAMGLAQRLSAQPRQAVQETKRALNLHVQQAIGLVAPFALSAEAESFATDDVRKTVESFTKKK